MMAGGFDEASTTGMARGLRATFAAVALLLAGEAAASIVIAGTRVVYDASDSEVTVKLTNVGEVPELVQTWIDAGDPKTTPSTSNVPFTVTPPVVRIDAQKSQALRIIYTGEPLPADRETVFWLNVLEIPPKDSASGDSPNQLQLAFRARIKLFFRPGGLDGDAARAPSLVRWHLVVRDGRTALEARNPGPYAVSITDVEVIDGTRSARFDEGDMLLPGETRLLPLTGDAPASPSAQVRFHTLNDYGGAVEGQAGLQ